MDIFALRDQLVEDYLAFTGSFLTPRDPRIEQLLAERLAASEQWPDPWLSLNPSFASGGHAGGGGAAPTGVRVDLPGQAST